MVNPAIVERSEETMVVWDACLSFLFVFCRVVRHREVTVRYQDLEEAWHEIEAGVEHDLSELLQHEIDHLDGVLFLQRLTPERRRAAMAEIRSSAWFGSAAVSAGVVYDQLSDAMAVR